MPQFDFTDEDAAAITTVLQGLTKEKMPLESMRRLSARDVAVEAGRKLISRLQLPGLATSSTAPEGRSARASPGISWRRGRARTTPPPSPRASPRRSSRARGSKVQPDWLFGFFKAPSPIRPWLAVRMPTFGFADEEANALVNSFASKDQTNFPFRTLPQEAPHGPEMQAAVKMFRPDYFNCWNCHQRGAQKPSGPPEGWAPDLNLAHQRLNRIGSPAGSRIRRS